MKIKGKHTDNPDKAIVEITQEGKTIELYFERENGEWETDTAEWIAFYVLDIKQDISTKIKAVLPA